MKKRERAREELERMKQKISEVSKPHSACTLLGWTQEVIP